MHIYLYSPDPKVQLTNESLKKLLTARSITTNSTAIWHQLKRWSYPVTPLTIRPTSTTHTNWVSVLKDKDVPKLTQVFILCDLELKAVQNLRTAASSLNLPYEHL